jgi:hypothetical protein
MVFDPDKKKTIEDLIAERDQIKASLDCARCELRLTRERLAGALRSIGRISHIVYLDGGGITDRCGECGDELSDDQILAEAMRCEECDAARRAELAHDEAEEAKVDSAVEADQERRHAK